MCNYKIFIVHLLISFNMHSLYSSEILVKIPKDKIVRKDGQIKKGHAQGAFYFINGEEWLIKNASGYSTDYNSDLKIQVANEIAVLKEALAGDLYSFFMNHSHVPETMLVNNKDGTFPLSNQYLIGSKLIPEFKVGQGGWKIPPSLILVNALLAETDFNSGNYGTGKQNDEIVYFKIDHGGSLVLQNKLNISKLPIDEGMIKILQNIHQNPAHLDPIVDPYEKLFNEYRNRYKNSKSLYDQIGKDPDTFKKFILSRVEQILTAYKNGKLSKFTAPKQEEINKLESAISRFSVSPKKNTLCTTKFPSVSIQNLLNISKFIDQ